MHAMQTRKVFFLWGRCFSFSISNLFSSETCICTSILTEGPCTECLLSDAKALAHSQRTLSSTSFNISKKRFMSGPWWQRCDKLRETATCLLLYHIVVLFEVLACSLRSQTQALEVRQGEWDKWETLWEAWKKGKKGKRRCSHCFWLCERSRRKGTRRAFFFTPPLAWKPNTKCHKTGDREFCAW